MAMKITAAATMMIILIRDNPGSSAGILPELVPETKIIVTIKTINR